jgi:hypothetical protein
MSNQFIPIERDSPLVVSVQELLAGDHLARFIVSIVVYTQDVHLSEEGIHDANRSDLYQWQ